LAFLIYRFFKDEKEILILASGVCLLGCAVLVYKFYRLDPIDQELIINEQAINLTSQYTENFRTYVHLDDFIQELKNSKHFKEQ
jgi:hypothetical protein